MAFSLVSDLFFFSAFPFDRGNPELLFLGCVGGPIPQLEAVPISSRYGKQALSPLGCIFQLKPSLLGSGSFFGP